MVAETAQFGSEDTTSGPAPPADSGPMVLSAYADAIGKTYHRYILIHNELFKTRFSLRRVIGLGRQGPTTDHKTKHAALSAINADLEQLVEQIVELGQTETEEAVTLLTYGLALRDSILLLRKICGKLYDHENHISVYERAG